MLLGYFPLIEHVASSPPLCELGLVVSQNYGQTA